MHNTSCDDAAVQFDDGHVWRNHHLADDTANRVGDLSGWIRRLIFVRGIAFDWFIEKKWWKLLEQSGEANQTLHYIIGPEWLEVNTKDFTSRVRYAALYKWKDSPDMLLIYRNASYFQVVPCSQFSPEGRIAIRNRLSHFIG